ncbi:sugar transferase [Streptomyces albipurpureus]|uniref:Sugar transferase n=1 Tax=Streptomyces albipurpureus TaxID=2897419 RepID=A0ABT0UM73_9ACTN|nr:sugar transferase [Streptomyces sp. CWNU-1]MCM2389210.1 sugar transferase [Streptomyces sp. CWNU-1]
MTTESVPAHHTARTMAVTTAIKTTTVHPPRGATRRRAASGGGFDTWSARDIRRHGATAALLTADAFAVALTVALLPPRLWPAPLLVLLVCAQPALHACRGLYRPALSPSALTEAPTISGLAVLLWLAVAETIAAYDPRYAATWRELVLAVVVQTALCCAGRALVFRLRRALAVRHPQSVLIVGRTPLTQQVTTALYDHADYGMRPVGQVDTARPHAVPAPASDTATLPVLTTAQDVSRAIIQNAVRHAVFTQPPASDPDSAALLALFTEHRCGLWLVDGGAAIGTTWRRAAGHDHLWGFSVQPLRGALHRPLARMVKRTIDTLIATAVLVFAAPVMAVCALAVRIADGPGVLFRQERIGLGGRPFTLLKFRTLRPADEQESATRWNVAFDRRMSATGNLLRRTSLDELPQLWNVLRGDMSLVGPRPERPYFVAKFSHAHPGYRDRHRMPVGITGLAQVHGLRGDTSIEERARFDNLYIETWSPWQDVCILARTATSLFRLGGS